jgi:RES domain-containing protein
MAPEAQLCAGRRCSAEAASNRRRRTSSGSRPWQSAPGRLQLMDVYRIGYRRFSKSPLNGEGSFLFGGRWSSSGTRMAYTSTTLTLAMAEFLAHVKVQDFDIDAPPRLIYVHATLPTRSVRTLDQLGLRLPRRWNDVPAPTADAALGDAWVRSLASLALVVPSVHVPLDTPERNVLINPVHPAVSRIVVKVKRFAYDRRLFAPDLPDVSSRRSR